MDLLQAIILGITEGLTEFLPISSTGHMILVSHLLQIAQSDFIKSFEIFIQLGAILAVVVLYWKDLLNTKMWPKIIAGFLPTAIIGLVLYKFVKNYLLGNLLVVLSSLFIGGIILIFIEKWLHPKGNLTVKKAFGVGLFQAISIIPGVSRSAATIVGAMLLGVPKEEAVSYSFLLAVPTLAAATGLDLVKSHFSFTTSEWGLLFTGFTAAFITAIIAIKFFLKYIRDHSFRSFGIYRIILSVVYYFVIGR